MDMTPDQRAKPTVELEVERWLRDQSDVRQLVLSWGLNLEREDAAAARLASLEQNVQAEIPDYEAFRAAVEAAQASLAKSAESITHAELLRKVGESLGDQSSVLRRLNQRPSQDQLPFIETVPIRRGKVISWRTPVDQTIVRKRPRDTARFLEDLAALAALFAETAVRQAAEQLRRSVERPNGYIVTPLGQLRQQVEALRSSATDHRLSKLRSLLGQLQEARQANSRAAWTSAAQAWVDTGWMLPSVQQVLLGALLRPPCAEFEWSWSGWRARRQVALLRAEVDSGVWNGRELRLRLRHWVANGVYVPTITFTLLGQRAATPSSRPLAVVRPLRPAKPARRTRP